MPRLTFKDLYKLIFLLLVLKKSKLNSLDALYFEIYFSFFKFILSKFISKNKYNVDFLIKNS